VYVFELTDEGWSQTAKLVSWPHPADVSVAIQGDLIVVGRNVGDLPADTGAVYLFQRTEDQWVCEAQITPDDGLPRDLFGSAVATDGQRAVTGCAVSYAPAMGSQTVYVLELSGPGLPWLSRQPVGQVVPAGSSVSFSAAAAGCGNLTYRWRKNGLPLRDDPHLSGATTNALTIDPVSPTDAGIYDLLVSNLCGRQVSRPATLTVLAERSPHAEPSSGRAVGQD